MSETKKPAAPKSPVKSPRRRAREFALQGLYQWRLGANDGAAIEAYLPELEGYGKADRELCIGLLRGVQREHEALAAQLTPHLDRAFAELSPIEACILLLAAFELVHQPQTPYRVVINEAIELAKAFGGSDGHKYVNGVLDKLAGIVRAPEIKENKR